MGNPPYSDVHIEVVTLGVLSLAPPQLRIVIDIECVEFYSASAKDVFDVGCVEFCSALTKGKL